ncbi:MAG: sialidase family protein, partial [Pyrinomonadaceae bacterium]
MNIRNKRFYRLAFFLLALTFLRQPVGIAAQNVSSPKVILLRAPDGGIQPQAAVDSKGIVHLIYYKGDAQAGDVFYVRLDGAGKSLAAPIRVNSQSGSAIAMGWVRGAQIAIGRGDRVHIIWNGSGTAEPRGIGDSRPMLYTRLNDDGTAFELQRNLITWAGGIDGGGALAADREGSVYVFWHAQAGGKSDADSSVFVTRSTDDGRTFSREAKANPEQTGACGCCAMKAFIDRKGILYVLYRAAGENVNRDTTLLVSRDKGKSFESRTLALWKLDACPLTVYSITQGAASGAVLGAWKNQEQVYFAALNALPNTGGKLLSQLVTP